MNSKKGKEKETKEDPKKKDIINTLTKQDKAQQIFNDANIYDLYIHYQHTSTSLQNNIPHPEYTTHVQIHHFKTTFMCPRSIAGVPSNQALPGFNSTSHHLCAFLM